MNRNLAAVYLRLMRRPLSGLSTLNWVTEPEIRRLILRTCPSALIQSIEESFDEARRVRLKGVLPARLRSELFLSALTRIAVAKRAALRLGHLGREEQQMDLWVTKT
jgi:hypothetical protein